MGVIQLMKQLNYLKRKLGDMTPAEKAGLVVGEVYVVSEVLGSDFSVGDKVRFIRDDGSTCPRFKRCYDGYTQYVALSDLEPKQLSPQQQLEELLKTQQEQTAMITALQEQIKKEEGYDCVTPVCRSKKDKHCILFDDNKQSLSVDFLGKLKIDHPGANIPYMSEPNLFKWIPIDRSELKPGDIAYRTNKTDTAFVHIRSVCAIIDREYYWFTDADEIVIKDQASWKYWYKLVLK